MTKYILFIVLTLSLLCSSAQAQVDRAGIRNMARELIQDSNSDTSRQAWTNARINAYIDIAHLDMVKKTACLIGTTYYTLYTGTQTYNMPSDLLEVSRVSIWKSSNVYQALTSDRPYHKAFSKKQAIDIIKKASGTQFDPRIADIFLKIVNKEK